MEFKNGKPEVKMHVTINGAIKANVNGLNDLRIGACFFHISFKNIFIALEVMSANSIKKNA